MKAWMVRYETKEHGAFYHLFVEQDDAVRFIQNPGEGITVKDSAPQEVSPNELPSPSQNQPE